MTDPRSVFLLPNLQGGGAERVTLNVVSGIVSRGGIASICMLGKPEVVYPIPGNLVWDAEFILPRTDSAFPGARSRLLRLAQQVRACDLLVGALEIKTHLAAVLLGLIFRRPVVLWLHKDLHVFLAKKTLVTRWLYRAVFHFNLLFARKVVAVSAGAGKNLAEIFPRMASKIVCIHNPIDFSMIDSTNGEYDAEALWMQDQFILAVGRMVWQKGFDTLLEAFQSVVNQFPKLKLVILGDGELRSDLERKLVELGLSGRVELPGFVNPYPAMARATAVVMSSRSEGLPTVLIEALHCGARIVSTDCPVGPAEILCSGKYGTLVPVDVPSLLATGIVDVLTSADDDTLRAARQARARDFSFERIIPEWSGLLFLVATRQA